MESSRQLGTTGRSHREGAREKEAGRVGTGVGAGIGEMKKLRSHGHDLLNKVGKVHSHLLRVKFEKEEN